MKENLRKSTQQLSKERTGADAADLILEKYDTGVGLSVPQTPVSWESIWLK